MDEVTFQQGLRFLGACLGRGRKRETIRESVAGFGTAGFAKQVEALYQNRVELQELYQPAVAEGQMAL